MSNFRQCVKWETDYLTSLILQPYKSNKKKKIVKSINLKEQDRMLMSRIGDGLPWGKENLTWFGELEDGRKERQV